MFDIRMDGEGRLVASGRLDAAQVAKADAVLSGLQGGVVADLAGLDYISSAGLGVLVKTQLRLQASGHALKLVNVHPRVKAIFHYAGLEATFGIE
jgi:anti-anti-sigma factor